MQKSIVATIIGPDRPGLVGLIAATVNAHEGNWLESRMSHLAGQFAGMLHVELPASAEAALIAGLEALREQGLSVSVVSEDAGAGKPPAGGTPGARELLRIEVIGQDRPGIVRHLSEVLARNRVNVEDLSTECSSAPWSGETLFKATALLSLPEGLTADDLRLQLEEIAVDLVVDIDLTEPEPPPQPQPAPASSASAAQED